MERIASILLLVLLMGVFLLPFGGSQSEAELPPLPAKEEALFPPATAAQKETFDWQEGYPYDLAAYVTLPSPVGVQAKYAETGECTPEELWAAIDQIRLPFASFEEKAGPVERFDRVTVSYQLVLEGQILEEQTQAALEIVVGQEGIPGELAALGEALKGAMPGQLRWADYTYPESILHGRFSGKTVVAKGIVTKIERAILPEVTQDFVRRMHGFEEATLDDFYESVERDILSEKEQMRLTAIWSAFCDGVTVLGYPEAELQKYRNDYTRYYVGFAEAVQMELDTFLTEYLEVDRAAFDAQVETYAREMVKNDMIFTQLARTLGITLSEEDYQKGLLAYYEKESGDFASPEAFEAHYTKQQIWSNLVRDRALLAVVENAVRVE